MEKLAIGCMNLLYNNHSSNPKLAFFGELQIQLIAKQRIELAHTLILRIWLKDQVHIAIRQGIVSAFPKFLKPILMEK